VPEVRVPVVSTDRDAPVGRKRSYTMSRIRSSGTRPELMVEWFLHTVGASFEWQPRIHGRPDFLVEGRVAVFVDGCFWHGCPEHYREPKTRASFWRAKISRNRGRREEVLPVLRRSGYTVISIWEHAVNDGSYKGELWLAMPR